uniref:Uncharacterized protein n=2 Tax=Aegilops tauschii subsp. strangulata TaxID=200361 RepID=A0A452XME2_AEGTS
GRKTTRRASSPAPHSAPASKVAPHLICELGSIHLGCYIK